MNIRRLLLVSMLLPAFGPAATPAEPNSLPVGEAGRVTAAGKVVLKAKTVIVESGKSFSDGVIVIEDGIVSALGSQLGIPKGARVFDYGDATIVPGFFDAFAATGAVNEITDTTHAFTAGVQAVHGFRPKSEDLKRAASGGITALALAPPGINIACGIGAVVSTGGNDSILKETAFFSLALTDRALGGDRYPASLATALRAVEQRFKLAGTNTSPSEENAAQVTEALKGPLDWFAPKMTRSDIRAFALARKEIRPWIEVADPTTLRRVLDLAKALDLKPIIVASGDLLDGIEDLSAAKAPLILPALTLASSQRTLTAPARYAKAGIEFAFATRSEQSADSLRWSAALAAANGLDRTASLAAITNRAPMWLGLNARIGSLEVGHVANLAVFSGDPLNLSSAWIATFVQGEPVSVSQDGARKVSK